MGSCGAVSAPAAAWPRLEPQLSPGAAASGWAGGAHLGLAFGCAVPEVPQPLINQAWCCKCLVAALGAGVGVLVSWLLVG